jgi:hypothetical protein
MSLQKKKQYIVNEAKKMQALAQQTTMPGPFRTAYINESMRVINAIKKSTLNEKQLDSLGNSIFNGIQSIQQSITQPPNTGKALIKEARQFVETIKQSNAPEKIADLYLNESFKTIALLKSGRLNESQINALGSIFHKKKDNFINVAFILESVDKIVAEDDEDIIDEEKLDVCDTNNKN